MLYHCYVSCRDQLQGYEMIVIHHGEIMKRPESKHGKLIAVYSSRYGWTLKKSEKTQKSVGKKKSENKGKS